MCKWINMIILMHSSLIFDDENFSIECLLWNFYLIYMKKFHSKIVEYETSQNINLGWLGKIKMIFFQLLKLKFFMCKNKRNTQVNQNFAS